MNWDPKVNQDKKGSIDGSSLAESETIDPIAGFSN